MLRKISDIYFCFTRVLDVRCDLKSSKIWRFLRETIHLAQPWLIIESSAALAVDRFLWVSLAAADRRSRRRWALAKINCFALTYRRNCLFCGNLLRASTRKNRKFRQQNFLVKSRKTRRRKEFVVASWKFPAISWKLSDRSVGSLPIINLLALSMFSSRVEIASLECVHSISSE